MNEDIRKMTNIILLCLAVSIVLHAGLLMFTEANTYREWVIGQIIIQVLGAISLMYVKKYNFIALLVFFSSSVAFVYINAVFVNYGHELANLVLFIIFWVIYGGLIYRVREKFTETGAKDVQST